MPLERYPKHTPPRRQWYSNIPLFVIIILLVAPHPSIIIVLVNYHIRTLHTPLFAFIHAIFIYLLTFATFSSLFVCVTRDPGSVRESSPGAQERNGLANQDDELSHLVEGSDSEDESEFVSMNEMLTTSVNVDSDKRRRWCKKCQAPKPERTHHCSSCGRCVLKMDHHCPWLGSRCIGHRTYPAFVHFIACVTLQATYIGTISVRALWHSFNNPFDVDNLAPIHELCLTLAGLIFALVMGSFLVYHIYLILTNQTTLEHISPFLLLRYLPPLQVPPDTRMLSNPPKEYELSYKQRRLVKNAHGTLRMYDVGWRRNVAQVFGLGGSRYGWLWRLWCGGSSPGDGSHFPRNPRTEEVLTRLATALSKAEMERRGRG